MSPTSLFRLSALQFFIIHGCILSGLSSLKMKCNKSWIINNDSLRYEWLIKIFLVLTYIHKPSRRMINSNSIFVAKMGDRRSQIPYSFSRTSIMICYWPWIESFWKEKTTIPENETLISNEFGWKIVNCCPCWTVHFGSFWPIFIFAFQITPDTFRCSEFIRAVILYYSVDKSRHHMSCDLWHHKR